MVCSRAADAEESEERAPARPADHKCNILRVADRDPVARFARTLRPVHKRVQSVQPLVSARGLEAYFRCAGGKIARQFVLDRQHDCESASRGQRRKRGEKNQAIGISRGGRTTKIHAVVDGKGRPLNFTVTGGQVHDTQVVEEVLNTPRSPLVVAADKAYDSQTARQQIKDEGALPIIPNRRNAIKQAYCPKRFYRQRHKIENFFCRIKDWRRIATRYDKLARNFLAAATLIGALYWIKL